MKRASWKACCIGPANDRFPPIADIREIDSTGAMLGRIWSRITGSQRDGAAALDKLLGLPPAAQDTSKLFPVIVPIECMELGWPGPIERLGSLPLALAWAIAGEQNSFAYVSFDQADYWDGTELDWQGLAFRNLLRLNNAGGFGEKLDSNGRPFVKVMLQDDAMGPSRLLIPHLFDDVLGEDYMVALPERTCAIAYRADVSGQELQDVNGMISGCYDHGTEPVSPERFKASEFWQAAERYSQ